MCLLCTTQPPPPPLSLGVARSTHEGCKLNILHVFSLPVSNPLDVRAVCVGPKPMDYGPSGWTDNGCDELAIYYAYSSIHVHGLPRPKDRVERVDL